jgi:MerR family copper efflux transcriptional regulator
MRAASVKRGADKDLHQIGEVAEQVGLSLRTVRYYEEVGLLSPPTRTSGGFRLYGEEHLDQLRTIKQMKPLDFSIEKMRALLRARNELETATSARKRADARDSLERFADLASERCAELRKRLRSAERFAREIRSEAEGGD